LAAMSEVLSARAALPQAAQSHSVPSQTRRPERRLEKLDALLNVRSQERWPVMMMWAHSFFLGLSVAYLTSSSLPIFLTAFDVRLLPEALLVAAVLQFVFGLINDRFERRYAKSQLASFAVIVVAAGSLAAFTGLLVLPVSIAAFAVLVWSRIQRSMVQSEFWGLTSLLFDLRESKRLFSLIDSGSVLAKIIGFFSVPVLLRFLPISNLLLLSAITPLVSFMVVRRIRLRYRDSIDHAAHASLLHRHGIGIRSQSEGHLRVERRIGERAHEAPVLRSAVDFMLRHRYTASISLVTMLAVIGMNAIDFGFLREIDLKYSQQQQVASVLALIFGSAQIISMIVKAGIVGRVFQRFGAIRMSALMPIVLLAISVGGLIVSSTHGGIVTVWFFIALAVFVEVYSDAIHEPAIAISFQPLHGAERLHARKVVDDVVEPFSLAIAALILLVITLLPSYTLSDLLYLLIAVFIGWIGAGLWFVRQYRFALRLTLKKNQSALRANAIAPDQKSILESDGKRQLSMLRANHSSNSKLSEGVLNQLLEEDLKRSAILSQCLFGDELLVRAISYELRQSAERMLLLLAQRFDTAAILHIRDSFLAGDERHRANALEMLEAVLPNALAKRVTGAMDRAFVSTIKTSGHPSIIALKEIAGNTFYHEWTRNVANYFASDNQAIMPQLFERVALLHQVDLFSGTPDAVLSTIAAAMEEIHVSADTQIITKGELGTCLYIITRGSVQVHDGEHVLAKLGERAVVGELALLDPEPRSASVTSLEETTLLRLDWEVFYDLMTDNVEIARGALATLARRIRTQNDTIATLSATSS
jgi:ATP/ADP translocase